MAKQSWNWLETVQVYMIYCTNSSESSLSRNKKKLKLVPEEQQNIKGIKHLDQRIKSMHVVENNNK